MGKKVKTGKDRLDKYYHLAKEQGYRARSAFKLIQLVQKHDIFSRSRSLLDLCAAPGGWLQVAQKNMPVSCSIIGVDLAPIAPIRGVVTIQADITTQRCRNLLKKEIPEEGCDVVLHDGAPNVGTAWSQDAYAQNELVLHATKLCSEFLRPGGFYITKVFRSQDYTSILWVLQQLFNRVVATKPSSSRNVSAEIFVVCSGYKSPAKIDPKFFDPRHVFINTQQGNELPPSERPKRALKELVDELSRRHKQGYNEGDDYRESCVSEFLASDIVPAEFLVARHKLVFTSDNDVAQKALADELTNEEIKAYLEDIRVLGKREYSILLKWRMKLRKKWLEHTTLDRKSSEKEGDGDDIDDDATDAEKDSSDQEDVQERHWQKELFALAGQAKKDTLNEKRKRREKLRKLQEQRERSLGVFDAVEIDDELFSKHHAEIAFSKEDEVLEAEGLLDAVSSDDSEEEEALGEVRQHNPECEDSDESLEFEDVSRNAVDLEIAAQMEKQKMKSNALKKEAKRKKETRRQQVFAEWSKELEQFASQAAETIMKKRTADVEEDKSSDDEDGTTDIPKATNFCIEEDNDDVEEAQEDGTVMTEVKRAVDDANQELSRLRSERWLCQPLFQAAGVNDDVSDEPDFQETSYILPEMPKTDKQKRKDKRKREKEKQEIREQSKRVKIGPLGVPADELEASKAFEVVPVGFSSSPAANEDEEEEEDQPLNPKTPEEIAQVKALGSLMLNKRNRMDLIDGAYNRYAFNDDEAVPEWFLEEEEQFARPELPVTKEMMKQYRAKLKEISKRPIRKAAEAAGRKKMRLKKRLEKVRKQAESIAESTEHSEAAKAQSINKLTRKARREEKRSKSYIVSRRQGSGSVAVRGKKKGGNDKVTTVDRRLKKDKRAQKVAAKKIRKRK